MRDCYRNLNVRILITGLLLALQLLLLGGCTGYRTYKQAQSAEEIGNWDQAVLHYMGLLQQDPGNLRYRTGLLRAKIQAAHHHFEQAKRYRDAGALDRALVELQQAVQLDPTNQYAKAELEKVRAELEAAREGRGTGTLEELKEQSRGILAQPPQLSPRSNEPIDLNFPEPVSVMKIYQALGKAFGINVLFDPKLRDQEIAIELKQVTAQDALEILMRAASHFYKVLDEQSIIIVADTPQNRRNYEDLIIQTFFLSNSDVRDVLTMLRSLVDARKVAANERLNAIILRDTADKVKIAERIILANDKARAEVVVDVELLQINTSKLQDLGLSLDPGYEAGVSLDTGGGGEEGGSAPLRFSDVEFLNANNWILTVPNFLFEFIKSSTEAQALAKPQLRISEGEKAQLKIGDKVPIPVTSFNTANTVGSNVVPITSFQYQDVGITINIEPRVHHNEEVSLKVQVEVSNISGSIGSQPIIGNRSIDTTIRLRDGETNLLAGLIRTDETNTDDGFPGLSEIPVLGRLFSRKRSQQQRTDIVLTLTPHIIRRADITEEDLLPIWVGTESNITLRGGSPRVESEVEGPFDAEEGASPAEIQEQIRRRIRQLPRGLANETPEEGEEQQRPPAGVELVPATPPGGLFGQPPAQRPEPRENEDGTDLGQDLSDGDRPFGVPDDSSLVAASLGGSQSGDGTPFSSLASLTVGNGPAVKLTLVPQGLKVNADELFEVRVMARANEPVSHFPVTLAFDPELLEVVQVRAGDFLGGPEDAQVMADFSRAGRVVLGASRLGERPGVAGGGSLAYITFRALAPGQGQLEWIQTRALDEDLEQIGPVESRPSAILVGPAEPDLPQVPEDVPQPLGGDA